MAGIELALNLGFAVVLCLKVCLLSGLVDPTLSGKL